MIFDIITKASNSAGTTNGSLHSRCTSLSMSSTWTRCLLSSRSSCSTSRSRVFAATSKSIHRQSNPNQRNRAFEPKSSLDLISVDASGMNAELRVRSSDIMAVSRATPAVTCLRRSQSSRVSFWIVGTSWGLGGGRGSGRVSGSGLWFLLSDDRVGEEGPFLVGIMGPGDSG